MIPDSSGTVNIFVRVIKIAWFRRISSVPVPYSRKNRNKIFRFSPYDCNGIVRSEARPCPQAYRKTRRIADNKSKENYFKAEVRIPRVEVISTYFS